MWCVVCTLYCVLCTVYCVVCSVYCVLFEGVSCGIDFYCPMCTVYNVICIIVICIVLHCEYLCIYCLYHEKDNDLILLLEYSLNIRYFSTRILPNLRNYQLIP